jgi:hypothetical protein
MSPLTLPIRPRKLRTGLVLVGLGWLAAAGIATIPTARADGHLSDTEKAYVLTYHNAVCKTLTKYPSEPGVAGVLAGVMGDGFAPGDAADIVNASVAVYCPQWWPLLQAVGDAARASDDSNAYVA